MSDFAARAFSNTRAPLPSTRANAHFGRAAVSEAELTRSPHDVAATLVSLDPTGAHALAVTRSARTGAHETHYMHASWPRPRVLSKLAGAAVTAAGWQRQPRPGGEAEDDLFNTTG